MRKEANLPLKGEAAFGCDLPTETLQSVQTQLLIDPPEIQQHAGDLCSKLTNDTAKVEREVVKVEMCPIATGPEQWDLRGHEPAHTEDQRYNSQDTVSLQLHICETNVNVYCMFMTFFGSVTSLLSPVVKVDCSPAEGESTLTERKMAGEPVSAMERERTMRNLVDMQRKVEQRQQRDKERQLLRVSKVQEISREKWIEGRLTEYSGEAEVTCHSGTVCLSGSGASVDHSEQKGRGRPPWAETHRQAQAPHTRSTTGKMM